MVHGSDVSVVPQPPTKEFGEIDSIAQLITQIGETIGESSVCVHTYKVHMYVCVCEMCAACLTLLRGHEQSEVTGLMCNKMYSIWLWWLSYSWETYLLEGFAS